MTQKTVCLLAALGAAGIFTAARGDYVTLMEGDGSDGRSFNGAGHWSDGLAPHSGADYLVALGGDECGDVSLVLGMNMANFSSNKTFGGDSLTLGELNGLGGFVQHRTTKQLTYKILNLVKGCYWSESSGSTTLAGDSWHVLSPIADPFSFAGPANKKLVIAIKAPISGAEGTCLQVRSSAFAPDGGMTELDFSGDNDGFKGRFRAIGPNNSLKFVGASAVGTSSDCSVALADGGILVCDDTSAAYDTSKKIWVEETGGCLETPENGNGTLAMTIGGDAPVRKIGTGKLTFSGVLDGTSMWVTKGELVLSDGATLVNGADFVVLNGGVLTGSPTSLDALPVVVKAGGLLAAASDTDRVTLSAANIELDGGIMARIDPAGVGSSVVTLADTCTVAWPLTITIDQAYPAEGGADMYPVVRIPTSLKTVSKSDFRISGRGVDLSEVSLGCSIQEQGGYQVVSIRRKGAPVTLVVTKSNSGNAFSVGSVWSDTEPAGPGKDYLVYADTATRVVRSGLDSQTPEVFQGDSLTLMGTADSDYWARLYVSTVRLDIDDLTMKPYSAIVSGSAKTGGSITRYEIGGRILVDATRAEGGARISDIAGNTISVDARLLGDSDALVKIYPFENRTGVCTIELLGDNSSYFGSIDMEQSTGKESLESCQELVVEDERNLGGNPASSMVDALKLSTYGRLTARRSLTIDDANRGIYIYKNGQFAVPDATNTLTVLSDITIYGGSLHKVGPGTLKLGGTMRFGKSGTATNPGNKDSKSIIEVHEGALQLTKGALCSKVQLKVANAGCLRIAPQSEEADEVLKTKGLVVTEFTDGRDHIVPADEGGKINIDLVFDDSAPELRNSTVQVPLLTVPESVANQIRGSIALTYTPTQSHRVSLMERVVPEGVQFYAEYKGGFLFIIR